MAHDDGFSQKGFESAIEQDNRGVCQNLAQTRSPYGQWTSWADTQSYSNCAIECCRQIINHVRGRRRDRSIHQEELLLLAAEKNLLAREPGQVGAPMRPGAWAALGGASPKHWQGLLREFAIGSSLCDALPAGSDDARQFDLFRRVIVPALLARKGCIVPVWASVLWPEQIANRMGWTHGQPGKGPHAVVPFAFSGNHVLMNDTGQSRGCGRVVGTEDLISSLMLGASVLVTHDPIWA